MNAPPPLKQQALHTQTRGIEITVKQQWILMPSLAIDLVPFCLDLEFRAIISPPRRACHHQSHVTVTIKNNCTI